MDEIMPWEDSSLGGRVEHDRERTGREAIASFRQIVDLSEMHYTTSSTVSCRGVSETDEAERYCSTTKPETEEANSVRTPDTDADDRGVRMTGAG